LNNLVFQAKQKIKKYIILFIILLFNLSAFLYAQGKDELLYSAEELKEFSIRLTKAQIHYNNMRDLVDFVSKDSLGMSDSNGSLPAKEVKDYILEKYKSLDTQKDIYCSTDSTYIELTNSLIFNNEQEYVYDGPIYTMAIGFDGKVFFLHGFGRNDFQSFIRHKVRHVFNKDIAYHILKLYLNKMIYIRSSYMLIDSANITDRGKILNFTYPRIIKNYKFNEKPDVNNKYILSIDSTQVSSYKNNKILRHLYPLKLKETKNKYEFRFITLEKFDQFEYASVISNNFIIYKNCKIKYSSRNIRIKKS